MQQCLEKIHLTGAKVINITCDGPYVNIATLNKLGANFSQGQLKTKIDCDLFEAPVFVILDNCHMIKNVRNAFHHLKTFTDMDGRTVSWRFIEKLVNLQTTEGLHSANKLSPHHVNFHSQKMKVKLAAQIFSESAASSLDYCRQLNLPEFSNSEATSKCLRIFNNVFDILNTRNLFGKYSKSPLSLRNQQH